MDNLVNPDGNIAISWPHNINEENNRLQGLVGTLRRTVARMVDIDTEIADRDAEEKVDKSGGTSPTKAKSDKCNESGEQPMDTGKDNNDNPVLNSPTVDNSDFSQETSEQSADPGPSTTEEESETDIFLKGLLGEIVVHKDQLNERRSENDIQTAIPMPQDFQNTDDAPVEFPVFDLSELITEAPEQCFNFSSMEAEIPSLELDFDSIINENSKKSVNESNTQPDKMSCKIEQTAEEYYRFLNDPDPLYLPEIIKSTYINDDIDGKMNSDRKLTNSADSIDIDSEKMFCGMEIDNDPFTLIDFEDEISETGKSVDLNKMCDNNPKPNDSIPSKVTTEIPNISISNDSKTPQEVKAVSHDGIKKKLKSTGKITIPKDYKVKYSEKMAKFLGIDMEEPTENAFEKEEVPENSEVNEPEVSGRGRRKCTLKKKTCYEGYEKKTPAHDPELLKFGKHLMASYHAILTDYQTEMKTFVDPPTPKKNPVSVDLDDDNATRSPNTLRELHFEQLNKFYAEQNRPVCIDLVDENTPCSSKSVSSGKTSTTTTSSVSIDEINIPSSSKGLGAVRKSSVDKVDINTPGPSKGSSAENKQNNSDITTMTENSSSLLKNRATRKRARQFAEKISLENECSNEKEAESTAKAESTKKQFAEDKTEDEKKAPFDRDALAALMEEKFNKLNLSEGTRAFMKAAPKMEGCLLPFTSRLLGTVWGNKKPTNTDPPLVSEKRNCELRRLDKEKMVERGKEMRFKYGDDVDIFIDENKEMITTVELYHPIEKGYLATDQKRRRGKPKVTMVLEALSSNTLEELCNNFLCSNDYVSCQEISHPDKYLQHNLLNRDAAYEKLPTATLLIDSTLYCFKDEKKGYNTANLIDEWIKSKLSKGVGPFKNGDLSTALLGDQTIRYGYPYVYIHLGCCEHIVIFRKSRLINSDDNMIANSYPMIQSIDFPKVFCRTHKKNDKLKNIKHKSTAQYLARYAVMDCDRLPDNPTLLCQTCVGEFLYDTNGNKVGSFKLYPFVQVHATVKDKY